MIVLDGGTGNCQFIRSVRQSGGNSMLAKKNELGVEDCSFFNWAEPGNRIFICHALGAPLVTTREIIRIV